MSETAAPQQPELIRVLVPMALPSPASPPPLLSGSGSPPTPCQAVSALLTGNKTNLTIKSESFFFSSSFFFLGYVLKRLSGGRTECRGWQGREGRSAEPEVGRRQLRPEPLWTHGRERESHRRSPGRGGCVGRDWEGKPAGENPSPCSLLILSLLGSGVVW